MRVELEDNGEFDRLREWRRLYADAFENGQTPLPTVTARELADVIDVMETLVMLGAVMVKVVKQYES